MEYLMTYSWAILIVLVVGLFLWQIGVFRTGSEAPVITGFNQLRAIPETIVYDSQPGVYNFTVAILNTVGAPLSVPQNGITMVETVSGYDCSSTVEVNDQSVTSGAISISTGDAFVVTGVCTAKTKGEKVNMHLVIKYDVVLDQNQKTSHTEDGYIQVTVE